MITAVSCTVSITHVPGRHPWGYRNQLPRLRRGGYSLGARLFTTLVRGVYDQET